MESALALWYVFVRVERALLLWNLCHIFLLAEGALVLWNFCYFPLYLECALVLYNFRVIVSVCRMRSGIVYVYVIFSIY